MNDTNILYMEKENSMEKYNDLTKHAFVLSEQKSEEFLKQDGQYKKIMAKYEKYTKKSHRIPKK